MESVRKEARLTWDFSLYYVDVSIENVQETRSVWMESTDGNMRRINWEHLTVQLAQSVLTEEEKQWVNSEIFPKKLFFLYIQLFGKTVKTEYNYVCDLTAFDLPRI